VPQHFGLSPNVNDFRLSCRTYTTNPLNRFLYWNMNYHIEHHMYAAVPCYHLPKLRQAIAHDLPPANRGLLDTWREMLAIQRRQTQEPGYCHVPRLPTPSPALPRSD
jgi:fatty acid desaturase